MSLTLSRAAKTEMIAMRLTSVANDAMETLIASSSLGKVRNMTPRYQTGTGALDVGLGGGFAYRHVDCVGSRS